MSHRIINKLGQLGDGDGGYVVVVCDTLYFVMVCLYAVNSKEVPWEERTIYYWASLLCFPIFESFAETMKSNQRGMVFKFVIIMLLFPCSYFHNTRLSTSESCEHTFIHYHKVEIYFTVERFL